MPPPDSPTPPPELVLLVLADRRFVADVPAGAILHTAPAAAPRELRGLTFERAGRDEDFRLPLFRRRSGK